jgi:hypothetical protein
LSHCATRRDVHRQCKCGTARRLTARQTANPALVADSDADFVYCATLVVNSRLNGITQGQADSKNFLICLNICSAGGRFSSLLRALRGAGKGTVANCKRLGGALKTLKARRFFLPREKTTGSIWANGRSESTPSNPNNPEMPHHRDGIIDRKDFIVNKIPAPTRVEIQA